MIVHDLVDAPIDRPCASMHGVGGTVTVGTGQVCVGCNPIRGGRGRQLAEVQLEHRRMEEETEEKWMCMCPIAITINKSIEASLLFKKKIEASLSHTHTLITNNTTAQTLFVLWCSVSLPQPSSSTHQDMNWITITEPKQLTAHHCRQQSS